MKSRIKTLTALLSLLLVACMSLTLTACGDDDDEPETTQTYEWGFGTLQASTPDFLSDMNKITDAFKSALGATGNATSVTRKGTVEKTDAEIREACKKAFDSLMNENWHGNYTFMVTNTTTGKVVASCSFSANDSNFI